MVIKKKSYSSLIKLFINKVNPYQYLSNENMLFANKLLVNHHSIKS